MAAVEDAGEFIFCAPGSDAHWINMSEMHPEFYGLCPEDREKHDTQTTSEGCESQSAVKGTSCMDQGSPMEVIKENVSAFMTCVIIPSYPEISETKHHICEGLNLLTEEQPEPDLQSTKPTPAFTDESTSTQTPSEINWDTNKQDWTRVFQLNKQIHEIVVKQRCEESEEGIPAVVVTQPEEVSYQAEDTVKHQDVVPIDASPGDGTELTSCDLQSLKSDTASIISGKSDEQEGLEEDTRSVTASSVMSLFHRIQMDPIEREWLRCAALGKAPAMYMLLQQDNTLVSRKTALHWAAKQGRVEMADMMARSGADVNQRAHGGYTPLHLASLHGNDDIIQLLINNYNAKVSIRDYHGKMAAHYWNGSMDIFKKHGSHSSGRWSGGKRGQCYAQLSALLSRSRSHGNISVEICASPLTRMSQSPSP